MNKKDIIIEYDYVRALTMLFVLLGHCTYTTILTSYGGISIPFDNEISIVGKALNFLSIVIYSFHMPLFMALSGCMWAVVLKKRGLPTFSFLLKDKGKRLLIPFLITALFWSIPLKYISGYWDGSISEVFKEIFWGQIMMRGNANSHLWFLQALFWVFIFSFIIEKYKLRTCRIRFLIILLSIFLLGKLISSYRILNIPNACMNLIWFYLGFLFEHKRFYLNEKAKKINNIPLVLGIIIYPIFVLGDRFLPENICVEIFSYFVLAFAGICLTYVLCLEICNHSHELCEKRVNRLSVNSYDLYLYSDPINYIILTQINSLSLEWLYYTNLGALSIYILRFLVSFWGAYLVIVIINKLNVYVPQIMHKFNL